MARIKTSTSTAPASRSTTRTGPSRSSRAGIEHQRAEPPSLPIVDHRSRHLSPFGPLDMADVTGQADALGVPLVDRDHRLAVVMVDVGQIATPRLVQLRHWRKKPPIA